MNASTVMTVDWFDLAENITHNESSSLSTPSIPERGGAGGGEGSGPNVSQVIYILIGIVGLLGNGITILVLASSKLLRSKTTNMFIINQSIIDFMSSVFLIAHSAVQYNSEGFYGIGDELKCRFLNSKVFMWASFNTSTYNLVVLTLERFFQIIYPIKHKTSFGRREALMVMGFAWAFGYIYQFALVIPTSGTIDGVCVYLKIWPYPEMGKTMGIVTAFVKYIIPLTIMIFSYGKMTYVILNKARGAGGSELGEANAQVTAEGAAPTTTTTTQNKSKANKMQQVGRNILKTLILVSLCFVVCWTGNQIIFLLFNLGFQIDFNGTFYNLTVYLVFANCCTNPFVYALQYKHFQSQFMWLFSMKKVSPDFGVSGVTTKNEKRTTMLSTVQGSQSEIAA